MFLYTELYQQTSFPRRAIEVDYELCYAAELGKVKLQEWSSVDLFYMYSMLFSKKVCQKTKNIDSKVMSNLDPWLSG